MRKPVISESKHGGEQHVYRFGNGYGASVIRTRYSYGSDDGLYELAVTKYKGDDAFDFELCYDTEITNDVIGHLAESDVDALLEKIEALPK